MNFSPDGLLSVDNLLYDILEETSDQQFREQTRGWYVLKMQQALTELSIDSLFLKLFKDYPMNDDRRFTIPEGSFNVTDIYVYGGELGKPTTSYPVWWKRNMDGNVGADYISRIRGGQDNVYGNSVNSSIESNRLFCDIKGGVVTLSESCGSYAFVRVNYRGTYSVFGKTPVIPPIFREYVTEYVVARYWKIMKGRYPNEARMRTSWMDSNALLNTPYTGLKDEAIGRAKGLDKKFKDDMSQYLAKMNY